MPQDHTLKHSTKSHFCIRSIFSFTYFLNMGNVHRHVHFCETILKPMDVFKDIDKSKAAIQVFGWHLGLRWYVNSK